MGEGGGVAATLGQQEGSLWRDRGLHRTKATHTHTHTHTHTRVHVERVTKAFTGNGSMSIPCLDPEASCLHSG